MLWTKNRQKALHSAKMHSFQIAPSTVYSRVVRRQASVCLQPSHILSCTQSSQSEGPGLQDREDEEDDEDLGMAANSILRTIPRHVLKALEQQQAEANEVNAESRVRH